MSSTHNPQWRVSATLAARAYQQASTVGIPSKDPEKCTTELLPIVEGGQGRTADEITGGAVLIGFLVVGLCCGAVGFGIGYASAVLL